MIELNSKIINKSNRTKALSRVINLGDNLELFIVIASKDQNFIDLLVSKILDFTVDKISKTRAYADFSQVLENINAIIKTWDIEPWEEKLSVIIWILNWKEFLFSNIWNSSCYLIKNNSLIEATDKDEKKSEFSYISNWDLQDSDIIVLSNRRLTTFLSESDFLDAAETGSMEKFNDSIEYVIIEEQIQKSISLISFTYKAENKEDNNQFYSKAKDSFYKAMDNNFSKRALAIFMILKDKVSMQSKMVKNILFISWILVSIFFMYLIISSTVEKTSNTKTVLESKNYLQEAKAYLKVATENMWNQDIFDLNINKTEELVKIIEEKKLFLSDITLLKNNIAEVKKTFNWIESFEENDSKIVQKIDSKDWINLLAIDRKIYIVWKNYVTWPIVIWQSYKKYSFDKLDSGDEFINSTVIMWEIAIVTKKWNIIMFNRNGNFRFSNVLWQDKWETSNIIDSFWNNIYLLSKEENQLYKHIKSGNSFTKWSWYLTKEDSTSIWSIIDVAIDWGFYMLKKDLTIVKFFSSPTYRLESIVLNKLPNNYNLDSGVSKIEMKTRPDLAYVYILLNNKVFVFKPNSLRYQDTKSLQYVWQIEWLNYKIKDFYISHDWELEILNENWVYKVSFEVSDDKLLLR